MRFLRSWIAMLVPFAALLGACNDPNAFRFDPILVSDTIALATPTVGAELPNAIDILSPDQMTIGGGRFAERLGDAGAWDFVLREDSGELLLLSEEALGLDFSPFAPGASITRPITDRSFDALEEAPSLSSFVADSAVVLREGAVYVARSRTIDNCYQFAKLQPIELSPAEGTVRLRVTTSARCRDPRLVPE